MNYGLTIRPKPEHLRWDEDEPTMITGMNHAVLYVRDARRQQQFYTEVLDFETVDRGPRRCVRVPACPRHRRITTTWPASRSVRPPALPPPGRQQVGLYHLAWEVPTLDDLEAHRRRLAAAGALHGASDHGVNKSLYCKDPDGIEFEVMWLDAADAWGDEADQAIVRPLDIAADIARYGGGLESSTRLGRIDVDESARRHCVDAPPGSRRIADNSTAISSTTTRSSRPAVRASVAGSITGEQLQLCFWRIAGGATGSFLHHHDEQRAARHRHPRGASTSGSATPTTSVARSCGPATSTSRRPTSGTVTRSSSATTNTTNAGSSTCSRPPRDRR